MHRRAFSLSGENAPANVVKPCFRRPLTRVERNFGYAAARACAGHTDGRGHTGSATTTYVRATLAEVATALSALAGKPRPLALN